MVASLRLSFVVEKQKEWKQLVGKKVYLEKVLNFLFSAGVYIKTKRLDRTLLMSQLTIRSVSFYPSLLTLTMIN